MRVGAVVGEGWVDNEGRCEGEGHGVRSLG